MFVKDVMNPSVITVSLDDSIAKLVSVMTENVYEAIPVKSNGKVVGMVTAWDLLSNLPKMSRDYLETGKVKDIMSTKVITVSPDEIVEMAAYYMYFHDLDALPVTDDKDELQGIVTESDLFRTFVTMLGLRTKGTRITLDVPDRPGVLADITKVVKESGISIASLATYTPPEKRRGNVILRVKSVHVRHLVDALVQAGFHVVHVSQVWE